MKDGNRMGKEGIAWDYNIGGELWGLLCWGRGRRICEDYSECRGGEEDYICGDVWV